MCSLVSISIESKEDLNDSQPGSQVASGSSAIQQDEFIVRIPRDTRRKFTMMKFGSGAAVDFAKLGDQPVKIERENNLKEYKTANDIDLLPKFGAGSEYGRDLKEESRRKKYGIMLKKYNPNDQPWNLKIGSGKQAKRYKGLREGTIADNTSYYIFTKAADGAFEAFPVEEWYNFSPIIKYKYLNSEEAEEEYSRRDKTLNLFNIMLKKRMKKDEEVSEDEDGKAGKKEGRKSKKKKEKDLILTDMDDWNDMKMSDEDDDSNDEDKDQDEESAAKKKPKKPVKKPVKNSKMNSDDEAVEESDEGDYDDREVDYMSDSSSSSSLSGLEEEDKGKNYDEKGVDQEAGLRNILDSEAEDDDEEEGEKEENEDEADEKDEKKEEKKKDDDDSSSSSLEDDSDIEKDGRLASALFLQKDRKEKREKKDEPAAESSQKPENRTPTPDKVKDKGLKRKTEGKSEASKRHKGEDSEGITEDAIRRYLMRKPMTTKDLLTKFKSKKLNMSNEKITHVIAQLLKKINPDKTVVQKRLYLSLKKPE